MQDTLPSKMLHLAKRQITASIITGSTTMSAALICSLVAISIGRKVTRWRCGAFSLCPWIVGDPPAKLGPTAYQWFFAD